MNKLLAAPILALLLTACGQPIPVTDPETGEKKYVTFGD